MLAVTFYWEDISVPPMEFYLCYGVKGVKQKGARPIKAVLRITKDEIATVDPKEFIAFLKNCAMCLHPIKGQGVTLLF